MSQIAFNPHIKNIFKDSVTSMLFMLDLSKYSDVKRDHKKIKRAIEGFGYRASGNYDLLEGKEKEKFLRIVRNQEKIDHQPEEDREFFNTYIDQKKYRGQDRAMPPAIKRGGKPQGPLTHQEITDFNTWIKLGMPEKSAST